MSRLPITPLEWGETNMTRIKLSIRLGAVGGIIWGLLFTSYYTMLPYLMISQEKRFEFAWKSASICFAALIIIIFSLPYVINEFKKAAKERRENQ
jgi:hypothetical protein